MIFRNPDTHTLMHSRTIEQHHKLAQAIKSSIITVILNLFNVIKIIVILWRIVSNSVNNAAGNSTARNFAKPEVLMLGQKLQE